MLIKKTAAILAAGVVLTLSANAAQAGVPVVVIATPSPSTASQSVTLSFSTHVAGCSGAEVLFSDTTGGGAATVLCNAFIAAGNPGVATCSTPGIPTGVRTIKGEITGAGPCPLLSATTSHTVNAAPTAVPTVGEWTMWGLTGLLLIGGGVFASRRFRTTAA